MNKVSSTRAKANAELEVNERLLKEAVDNARRTARVESIVDWCDKAMTKVFGKHEQLYSFADETTDPKHWKMI